MVRLIIFDLDGTLVNSSVDITNALNFAIGPYGIGKMDVGRTVRLVGEGTTRLIEKVLGEKKALQAEVLDRFLKYYSEHLSDFSMPYPGVAETLEILRGCKKVVISNKRELLSRKLLAQLGLLDYFEVVLGSDSVEERKPSPQPVLHVLGKYSVGPDEALVVGDSEYDLQMGRASGLRTVAVTYGFGEKKRLRDADFVIDGMEQLPGIVEKINGQAQGDSAVTR